MRFLNVDGNEPHPSSLAPLRGYVFAVQVRCDGGREVFQISLAFWGEKLAAILTECAGLTMVLVCVGMCWYVCSTI